MVFETKLSRFLHFSSLKCAQPLNALPKFPHFQIKGRRGCQKSQKVSLKKYEESPIYIHQFYLIIVFYFLSFDANICQLGKVHPITVLQLKPDDDDDDANNDDDDDDDDYDDDDNDDDDDDDNNLTYLDLVPFSDSAVLHPCAVQRKRYKPDLWGIHFAHVSFTILRFFIILIYGSLNLVGR